MGYPDPTLDAVDISTRRGLLLIKSFSTHNMNTFLKLNMRINILQVHTMKITGKCKVYVYKHLTDF